MSAPEVLLEVEGPIATVTMNRPERRNALNTEMVRLLAEAWDEIDANDAIRVAVLTGAGDAYCVGGDLSDGWMVSRSDRAKQAPDDSGASQAEASSDEARKSEPATNFLGRGLLLSRGLAKPLIAAVNGACLGGGCEMLQQTDIRVAEQQATFGLPEAKRGLIAGAGSTVRLKRQIPYTKAMEMILTGEPLTADEAHHFGLVGRVVETGRGLETAHELATKVAANGPLAVRHAKAAAVESGWLGEETARAIERRHAIAVMTSADAREGLRAFSQKRAPQFEGR